MLLIHPSIPKKDMNKIKYILQPLKIILKPLCINPFFFGKFIGDDLLIANRVYIYKEI